MRRLVPFVCMLALLSWLLIGLGPASQVAAVDAHMDWRDVSNSLPNIGNANRLAYGPAQECAGLIIDDFSTAQSALTLTYPPAGTSASSSATGSGIVGGERDMEINLTSGVIAGNTMTAVVSSSFFSYSQDATIAGNGNLTYDGNDASAALNPTGLGGVDLTANGGYAFAVEVAFDDLPVDLNIRVYTSLTEYSDFNTTLPGLIFSTTTISYTFASPSGVGAGGPADLTNVGAIVVTMGSNVTAPDLVLGKICILQPVSTPTATSTATATPTVTATSTATSTPTNTATDTPTSTATPTATNTSTSTATSTSTSTPTNTATATPTNTPNPEPAKPAVWRAGSWFLRNSLSSGPADLSFAYGLPTDKPLMCDWDGDGDKTPGVFRNGAWYLKNTNATGISDIAFSFGLAGDTPVCGDWDGNGTDTIGVVRAQGGGLAWHLRNSNTNGVADVIYLYGLVGDTPVVGDWNGDGTDTPGIVRGGVWYLRNSNSNGNADLVFMYGIPPGDRPIVGDWNGDTVDTVGVTRGDLWLLRNSNTSGSAEITFNFGAPGDTPLVWR